MNHKPYERIVSGANSAILFIHGILGSPDHFDFLIPIVPHRISVSNLLLDGHGKGVHHFSQSSMKKWETQVSEKLSQLARTHQNIYIVAHSMGTLFALDEALHQQSIKGLFLLAIPVFPFPRMRMLSNAYKVYTGKIRDNDVHGVASRDACSIQQDANIIAYLPWIKRYLELFRKVRTVRSLLPKIQTPCITFQSKFDEMVAFRSVAYLKNHSSIDVQILHQSWHNLYGSDDRQKVLDQFGIFLKNIK